MTRKREKPPEGAPEFKSFAIDVKAAAAAEPDENGFVMIKAYASVFGNLDSHGDVIVKGAYTESLAEWAAKGAPIPSFYNHGQFSNDPMDNIGYLAEAAEDEKGLPVTLALDVVHNPKAAYVHRLIKQDRLRELSIGYIAKEWSWEEDPTAPWGEKRNLLKVDLLEVSVVSKASNPLAVVTEKSMSVDYGSGPVVTEQGVAELEQKLDADVLTSLQELAATAGDAVAALQAGIAEALAAAESEDDGDEDEDSTDGDDPAGEKNGAADRSTKTVEISAATRAMLAMTALTGAE